MKQQDYHCSITADVTPEEAFDRVNDVSGWWAKNLEGSSKRLNDVFTVHFGKTFVTFTVTEFVPNKLVTWKVTDCYLHWINDKKEWNGTSVRFELSKEGEETRVTMTHIGLTPGAECYNDCEAGWNDHFGDSLLKLLTEQEGAPI
jgi:activator of Hsp90 ATPase-like protein